MDSMLAKCVKTNQKDWDEIIGLVAAIDPYETTKMSPNEIIFGKENRMAIDLMYGTAPSEPDLTPSEYIRKIRNAMEKSYALVRSHLQLPQDAELINTFPPSKHVHSNLAKKYGISHPDAKQDKLSNGTCVIQAHIVLLRKNPS